MTPNAIPDVKDKLRRPMTEALRAAARTALDSPDAAAARAAFKRALEAAS